MDRAHQAKQNNPPIMEYKSSVESAHHDRNIDLLYSLLQIKYIVKHLRATFLAEFALRIYFFTPENAFDNERLKKNTGIRSSSKLTWNGFPLPFIQYAPLTAPASFLYISWQLAAGLSWL